MAFGLWPQVFSLFVLYSRTSGREKLIIKDHITKVYSKMGVNLKICLIGLKFWSFFATKIPNSVNFWPFFYMKIPKLPLCPLPHTTYTLREGKRHHVLDNNTFYDTFGFMSNRWGQVVLPAFQERTADDENVLILTPSRFSGFLSNELLFWKLHFILIT